MIVALVGRRVDAADADTVRFPSANEALVRSRIHDMLAQLHADTLVSSAACGADLLAQEVAQELGIARIVVIALNVEAFRDASVTDRPGDWGERYDRMIASLTPPENTLVELHVAETDDSAWERNNRAILDEAQALARARTLDPVQQVAAVVVWEGQSRGQGDLTEHFLHEAMQRGLHVETVLTL